jgi:hypothetical protein
MERPTCPNYGKGAKTDCFSQCTGWRDSCNAQYERSYRWDLQNRVNSAKKVLYKNDLTFEEWSQKREQSTPVSAEVWLAFCSSNDSSKSAKELEK